MSEDNRANLWVGVIVGLIVVLFLSFGLAGCLPYPPGGDPSPSPTVSPEPTVTPSPSPAPTLLPTPLPAPVMCALPASSSDACEDKPSGASFLPSLHEAQRLAEANGFSRDGKVVDEKAYTDEIARLLRVMGLCAINGSEAGHSAEDEVWVKVTNEVSEHYDIVTSWGSVNDLYAARCEPAAF